MRTILCILYIIIISIFSILFRIYYFIFKRSKSKKEQIAYSYKWLQRICKGLLKCSGTKLTVKGQKKIPKDTPILFIANHKSFFDIPILVNAVDIPMSFVGKIQLKKVPVVSFWMKKIGCIFMDRSDIRQSLKAINKGIQQLKEGHSLLIFPEGTRIIEENLGEFKKGSLKLATKSNVPIIPIYIHNAHYILETQFPWIKAVDINVNIGDPIIIDKLKDEDKKRLALYVKNKIEDLRK
ncbi:lysophospholipid acyltransferase family protein [Defluviitalea phaphyphila]|uniref:lysophospholipid acyltransferase family protein n=1 Tax=Defluviitalea phaphyphila TaxID=1473580 RepID=UPI000730D254|nr:lysophospholipid acyltransferase family protein [Defluviitalea phaphyphila]